MSLSEELDRLTQLHKSGALDDHEFALAKNKLLGESSEPSRGSELRPDAPARSPEVEERQTDQWAFALHLSILAGYAVPLAGLVAPIAIWQLMKADLPGLDVHGKNAVNWIISHIIYAIVFGLLAFALIGIPLLIVLAIAAVVFPIIAAIKANQGVVWKYPLAIRFLK